MGFDGNFMLCRVELAGRIEVPRWAVFLGAASYAIYLVHVPTISVVARIVAWIGHSNWIDALLVVLCGATMAGIAYHVLVEAPLLRLLRRSSKIVA
jgi:peptidoglycan/LPS O-acetylase OafA/YrhL